MTSCQPYSKPNELKLHMTNDNRLVPVFIPALSAILLAAEDTKGSPLTLNEALAVRDKAAVIMINSGDVEKLFETRGYADIDPQNCWYDWQMLRRQLGRKPDMDPGVRVQMVQDTDPDYLATIETARKTLDVFRQLIPHYDPAALMVKSKLIDSHGHAFVWLFEARATDTGFNAVLFEIPQSIPSFRVGDAVDIPNHEILDWMINDNGVLRGGFSLRYHRSRLNARERMEFDAHIGVVQYVE